ncbi:PH, RCC1 and FYVE domains-containing protein 1-like isoform X4 [Panicum virgatum]|uniref:PH, RCC1 and FYVE domains-containing protein 1-like isoform X4 n=1 Tax=Panicum virgatum TaxID=38727 RepID=UPI0019D66A48|nr:PH, RCC1 and FYVE domains-containing protein 1-like isoform X4 [Panicum virgatum]
MSLYTWAQYTPTAIFQRYPRPDKEFQSFSLIYGHRSLDLICKDKDEAEAWFVGLKALISRWVMETKDGKVSDNPAKHIQQVSPLLFPFYGNDAKKSDLQNVNAHEVIGFGNIFSDVICTGQDRSRISAGSIGASSSVSSGGADTSSGGASGVSYSRSVSSSSYGSGDDFDSSGDVFIWGKGVGAYASHTSGNLHDSRSDLSSPKALDSTFLLDIRSIACGSKHLVLVTKQGEIYSWGEELGGRLGHGVDADVCHPKLIRALSGIIIESVACGEFHTCAVSFCGDLYTWGDGTHYSGVLGHGNDTAHWIPKKVYGPLEGLHISLVSCGQWHTAIVTSLGQLFTFGDGVFGALGHGDRLSTNIPRQVNSLKGMRVLRAACGTWHTAAIVEIVDFLDPAAATKLFTWGDGDRGQLGHVDREARFIPACVASLLEPSFCLVACGHDSTVALSTSGQVYTMGSNAFGQLGNPKTDGKFPTLVGGIISSSFIEEIACGSHHIAVLTSKAEVYTWGRGANGRLGHGDSVNRNTPTLVEALKDKLIKSVVCGADFTAAISLHKCASGLDQAVCSGCHLQFGFRRKRHNCYNCGLVFCKACSSRKSTRASLAPDSFKPYRVCDECYTKLSTVADGKNLRNSGLLEGNPHQLSREATDPDKSLRSRLSKLLTCDSFKPDGKYSLGTGQLPLARIRNMNRSTTNLIGQSKELISSCVPTSKVGSHSQPTSPLSSGPSSPNPIRQENKLSENLTEEVARLKSQVNKLTHKSELLEDELAKANNQLREVRATADLENLKCKAANEIISVLKTQIKAMTPRPECTSKGSWADHVSKLFGSHPRDNNLQDVHRPPDSSGQQAHRSSCNGNSIVADAEWIEQVEPGVYITVFRSPAGQKYLRHVRFSKRRFTEQQAELWWANHRSTLQEQYGILPGDSIFLSRTIREKG